MTINRSEYRVQLANLLRAGLSTVPNLAVYDYQPGDLKGASPVIVVTFSGSQRGDPTISEESEFPLEIHTFVLYSLHPVKAENSPFAGTDVDIAFTDTSMFVVGQTVMIDDDLSTEIASIVNVDVDVSVTVDVLSHNYTTPRLFIWSESHSEDQIDLLEYLVTDEVRKANDAQDMGISVKSDGQSLIDVVEIGGLAYRHEVIPVRVFDADFL